MSARRLLNVILVLVIAAAGLALLRDGELPLTLAGVAIAMMIVWWRVKLPPP